MSTRTHFIFLLFFCSLFSGCQLLQPQPDTTRLFLINLPQNDLQATALSQASIQLAIRRFPECLERPFLVTKISENELKEQPKYRWASPLRTSILYVLSEYIHNNFPKTTIYILPQDTPKAIDVKISITVDRFWAEESTQQVIFSGDWTYRDLKQKIANTMHFEFYVPFIKAENRYEGVVKTIEQAMYLLGQSVASKLDLLLIDQSNDNARSNLLSE